MTTSTSAAQVTAVSKIHAHLLPLDDTARVRVLQAVSALLGSPGLAATTAQPPGNDLAGPQNAMGQSGVGNANNIQAFCKAKKPTDTYQRLACLAYYLERVENKIDISVKELIKANVDARQADISNASAFLAKATGRHGYFTKAPHGKKRLSSRGEAIVEALPNQEAVKATLKDNPMPKKGGRTAKKRKKVS
jgi:hypothetical protein